MIIIYGHRNYGAVDEQGGQYAVTKFVHVYYLPLIPTSSVWITGPNRGLPTKLNGKSVLAAYARTWGLGLGTICLFTALSKGGIGLGLLGVVTAAMSIASWRWSRRRSGEAILRGDLNALAFGTYCSPQLFEKETASSMRAVLENRQRRTELPRTPEDVARFGTRDIEELSWAYGLLALHGAKTSAEVTTLLQLKAPSSDVQQGVYRDSAEGVYRPDGANRLALTTDSSAMASAVSEAAVRCMHG